MIGKGKTLIGGVEAGGTKFVLAIGTSTGEIVQRHTLETTHPDDTLREATYWFETRGPIAALGIASFGPLDLDRTSPKWGHITSTPKRGWANCDIVGWFRERLGCPVGFDTDVNAAALAEWNAWRQTDSTLAYVTVGTGIGGGVVVGGQVLGGKTHPEIGHIRVARHPLDRDFAGVCPYHGDCLEGLASGPAIEARWGHRLGDVEVKNAQDMIAHYLGQMCYSLFSITAVERIVLGGGVMQTEGLIELVREHTKQIDDGYLPTGIERQIETPLLGTKSGITGALLLASLALSAAKT
ncbi:ROK family protein [Parapontixanthobacter aurantiacus]|uniref:ROK family protein n=1 Tax=Parapontixanthobacter aurantiacus TaxID=1463599 RepID=UPI001F2B61D9|nr:ROK family protein [Parapontixanthobacter aurantiacus]